VPNMREVNQVCCRRCGRRLTNPESKRRGYGATCWKKIKGTHVHTRYKMKKLTDYFKRGENIEGK